MTTNESFESDKLRVNITLTTQQLHVIRELAKNDYRSMDQMIQVLLHLGFETFRMDNSLYIDRMPDDNSTYSAYTDSELTEMMRPIIPKLL